MAGTVTLGDKFNQSSREYRLGGLLQLGFFILPEDRQRVGLLIEPAFGPDSIGRNHIQALSNQLLFGMASDVLGLGRDVTGDGRALARDLSLGFEAIQRGVGQLRNDGRQDTVQVTMSPAFAVR